MTDDQGPSDEEFGSVDFIGCYYCGVKLESAVELVFDKGEVEWICIQCAEHLPRERLEHDAERVEARDLQLLPMADRLRPIEDVPPNERL